jgi:phage-related protein
MAENPFLDEAKPEILICDCHSTEHQLILRHDPDEEYYNLFINVHLITYKNVFKRIWVSLKYIFGYKCRYGHWDEFILNKKDADRFIEILKKIK